MAATDNEPPDKKVDDRDILEAFEHREELKPTKDADVSGKWELSSSEVATLVNDRLGFSDNKAISRQAIHRRLENMNSVVKVKHGRTVTWRLKEDTLTSHNSISPPAGNGGGGHRPDPDDTDTRRNRAELGANPVPIARGVAALLSRLANAVVIVALLALLSVAPALLGFISPDVTYALATATISGWLLHVVGALTLYAYEGYGKPAETPYHDDPKRILWS